MKTLAVLLIAAGWLAPVYLLSSSLASAYGLLYGVFRTVFVIVTATGEREGEDRRLEEGCMTGRIAHGRERRQVCYSKRGLYYARILVICGSFNKKNNTGRI